MASNTLTELEVELGSRIKALRLRQDIDQLTLASRAGCSVSALKNLENGRGATVKTLIAAIRALGREEWLLNVAPVATISPLNMPKAAHVRQRASTKQ